jgi:hypothetical protein
MSVKQRANAEVKRQEASLMPRPLPYNPRRANQGKWLFGPDDPAVHLIAVVTRFVPHEDQDVALREFADALR